MILPDFALASRANQRWQYSGIDSPENCFDKKHFESYPHDIEYLFNSRGYRDQEWPTELAQLKSAIWCIGDSFTVGLGLPETYTWPNMLQQAVRTRTINVSMDGASNDWIARKTIDVLQQISPRTIVIHWSYIHRAELDDVTLSDEDRRLHFDNSTFLETESKLKFIDLVKQVESAKQSTNVIHSFIPNFGFTPDILSIWNQIAGPDWPACPVDLEEFNKLSNQIRDELTNFFKLYTVFELHYQLYNGINYIPEIQIVDFARDNYHYGIETSKTFVQKILQTLND